MLCGSGKTGKQLLIERRIPTLCLVAEVGSTGIFRGIVRSTAHQELIEVYPYPRLRPRPEQHQSHFPSLLLLALSWTAPWKPQSSCGNHQLPLPLICLSGNSGLYTYLSPSTTPAMKALPSETSILIMRVSFPACSGLRTKSSLRSFGS